ncbi:EF hand domain-containing protein [Litoreibacter meonggei]|uniref:EF hand domain-containing protein n=1 Tax=Litoreibacter meonggei TaxID=1049199 RepID=A0A497X5P3_9RHOB|nr:EF-hand domain-containing protein [Litoreibacter meonggei]RLJ60550.1 EF hand domain-containing protein [Litoreibacter meonggei]
MAILAGNLKTKLALASVGLALALTPMIAHAKGGHGPRVTFEELDADGNGSVTEAEMRAHRAAHFAMADADGDGSLSRSELEAQMKSGKESRMERRLDRMMDHLDADDNGVLSQEELADAGGKRKGHGFSRMDKDGDGAVSKAEFEEMGKKHHGKRHGDRKHQD